MNDRIGVILRDKGFKLGKEIREALEAGKKVRIVIRKRTKLAEQLINDRHIKE